MKEQPKYWTIRNPLSIRWVQWLLSEPALIAVTFTVVVGFIAYPYVHRQMTRLPDWTPEELKAAQAPAIPPYERKPWMEDSGRAPPKPAPVVKPAVKPPPQPKTSLRLERT
jgi:hypothetical protein